MFRASWFARLLTALTFFAIAAAAHSQPAAFGFSWGYTRTYWDGTWYEDAYTGAGTAGNMFSVRREMPMNDRTRLAVSATYNWMRHTTTTLIEPVVIDPVTDQVISGGLLAARTEHSYFREIDVAIHAHRYVNPESRNRFYFGGGPAIRWGSAGRRDQDSRRMSYQTNAAWFGLSVVGGLRQQWKEDGLETFFEPQLLWSPDAADRYQETFPPVNLVVAMGVLW
ncbi:MAG: hypothetical protein IPG71_09015 [bacterium]|nr:hypothetical protein [bacterium]